MDGSRKDAQSSAPRCSLLPPSRAHARVTRKRVLLLPLLLICMLFGELLGNWISLIPTAYAAGSSQLNSQAGHLTLQQYLSEGQQSQQNQGKFKRPASEPATIKPNVNAARNKPLPSVEPATMHDLTYTLDNSFALHRPAMKANGKSVAVVGTAILAGTTPFQIKGSDGRLEVLLPRSSLDFAQAKLVDGSAPVGQLMVQIHQISGHFIESESILGTYQIQIVDSQGQVVQGVRLIHPLTIIYHYQLWEIRDLNIDPTQVHLSWPGLIATTLTAKQATTGLVVPMTNNSSAHTLTAQSNVLGGVMTASASPSIAVPTNPDLFEASGNAGQYSYSYPLKVVPGPAGFMPQLALSYSSQTTNGRHSRRSPAGDEGDGWSLSLGSITAATYPSSSTGGGGIWYSINGVDGISDRLVPGSTSGEYVTQHYSYLLIKNMGAYWKVWGKDGTYFEFGNTADSLQKTSAVSLL